MKQFIDTDSIEEIKDDQDIPVPPIEDETPNQSSSENNAWDDFINSIPKESEKKTKKLTCMIDSSIAYTLDECKIGDASRSDMINAILRNFIIQHRDELLKYRKLKTTLL